ncbi:ciliogenesis and planar polarity effector 2 isoform X3 [Syngnathus acus]|uniref:ciliogenesis and planar polarity effector 2 isoform X3 n=1 Tax=Syngnathus acus TaxID=161584 RepID=UPI0018863AF4|nr:ciliogenesis and planar polarity effector 2 isoform X3 [Syngnathus acus]
MTADAELPSGNGLLESPVMPPHIPVDTVHYKVVLSGKSGVGKSTLAARLAGQTIPSMHYETTGIETTVVYWPVKLKESGRVLFFRFQLWDCGENALRRFDHLLPSCKEKVDAVLFLFSFTDRTSFDDLANQITKWKESSGGPAVTLVVGTKEGREKLPGNVAASSVAHRQRGGGRRAGCRRTSPQQPGRESMESRLHYGWAPDAAADRKFDFGIVELLKSSFFPPEEHSSLI